MIDRGRFIADASVVVKWYIPEQGSDRADRLLRDARELLAPDLLLAEFGNVLWKKVRRGELTEEEARTISRAFIANCPVTWRALEPLSQAALDLALTYRHPIYDAYYLALAVAEDCPLVTADDGLVRIVRGTALESYVIPL